MKNILANFSGQVLSRGEMKEVKGGSDCTRDIIFTYDLETHEILIQYKHGTSFKEAHYAGIKYSGQTGRNIGTAYFKGTCPKE